MNDPIRILYVDDNPLDRELVRDVLEKEHGGFRVTEAGSRADFVARLAASNYDLVLSDFNILGFEGLQVLDIVYANTPDIPVIIVTGTGSEEVAVEALKRGAADYVIKTPIHIRRLPQIIHAALEKIRLKEERDRLFNYSLDLLCIAGFDGTFRQLNPAWGKTLGWTKDELLSKPYLEFVHPDDREATMQVAGRLVDGEMVFSFDNRYLCKDGSYKWMSWNSYPLVKEGLIFAVVRDITEHKQAKEELSQSKDFLENVLRTTPSGVFTVDLERHVTSWNLMAERITGYKIEEVLGKKCDLIYSTTCKDECRLFDDRFKKPGEYRECVIIRKDGKEIITLKNFDLILTPFGEIKGGIESFIDITDRKRVEEELQESLDKLRKAMNGIIQSMALTIETRDPYTSGHQQRVADLARSIAQEMGLSEDQVDGLRMAGIVHDLGKIAVPAEILSKPTKLNELELSLIKVHPQTSYDILKDIDFPWPLPEIVLQHHERMDGSGYPRGLKGDEILVEARILMVSDVVEAIASHRPYRPALGIEKALEEISQNKGILYDPVVVAACLRLFREKEYHFN